MRFDTRLDMDELMDVEKVSFEELRHCLVDLTRVNVLTAAYRPTLAFFDRILPKIRALGRPLEVVDVGSGYGDMLRAVHAWAKQRGVDVALTGVDSNPWAARAAREATGTLDPPIAWITANAFLYEPPRGVDVVVSSLFTHHIRDDGVVAFLGWMENTATTGWFVNDLHRHPLPYYFFRTFSKVARYHRFVQHDGPVSIARAFSRADWQRLVRAAGIEGGRVEITWKMPFRLTVTRVKP